MTTKDDHDWEALLKERTETQEDRDRAAKQAEEANRQRAMSSLSVAFSEMLAEVRRAENALKQTQKVTGVMEGEKYTLKLNGKSLSINLNHKIPPEIIIELTGEHPASIHWSPNLTRLMLGGLNAGQPPLDTSLLIKSKIKKFIEISVQKST